VWEFFDVFFGDNSFASSSLIRAANASIKTA